MGALELNIALEEIRRNILNYKGIKKRFDIIQNYRDCVIVDDYGHHPTEIKATIKALLTYKKLKNLKKIHIVWQPHKYSRTIDNLSAFVESLVVWIL